MLDIVMSYVVISIIMITDIIIIAVVKNPVQKQRRCDKSIEGKLIRKEDAYHKGTYRTIGIYEYNVSGVKREFICDGVIRFLKIKDSIKIWYNTEDPKEAYTYIQGILYDILGIILVVINWFGACFIQNFCL